MPERCFDGVIRALAGTSKKSLSLRWRWLLPVALLVVAFHFSPFSETVDRGFFDAASGHPLKEPPLPENSTIVLIDDTTMETLSREQGVRWPLPRPLFAQLFLALHQAGAKKIVGDFTFFEESDQSYDAILAGVSAATPSVILARTRARPPVFWNEEFIAANRAFFKHPRAGFVDFPADNDGVARRYEVPGSLAAIVVTKRPEQVTGLVRWVGGLEKVRTRGVPVISAAQFIHAGKPILERLVGTSPELTATELATALVAEPALTGEIAELVRGRTVFVGANASSTFDLKPFPVGKIEPGVLIHWTAWANLSTTGLITPAPRWSALLLAVAVAALVIFSGRNRGSLAMPLLIATFVIVALFGGAYALLSLGFFVPPATAAAASVLVLLGVIAEHFWFEQARKREIQAMFGAYVDPKVVDQLVRDPDAIELRGEKRDATVFFSDLAGFTDLSEKLPPEQMVEVVNAYLDETSECLHNHGAYVDKYIGDAVMAVFGVPQPQADHAYEACLAALEAQQAIVRINARYAKNVGVTLKVRIGLNSGEMIAGNLGSARKKNYTVMGDAVNLASRLEGANKEFGTGILLGETTARAVAGRVATRPLTRLRVKGKKIAIEVHELVGRFEDLTNAQRDFLAAYNAGYAHYSNRRFAEATNDFSRALAITPDDAIAQELMRHAQEFSLQPPPENWEPILTLETK